MRRQVRLLSAIPLTLILSTPVPAAAQSHEVLDKTKRHASGQAVAPVYDGWLDNDDGTVTLYFGYMNRNWEEAVDIPIGPANHMEPGTDRGQPAHFLPRRQLNVFTVV